MDKDEEKREIYLQERKTLIELQKTSFQQFDKAILALSSGGLGFSLLIFNNVIDPKQIECKALLILSWICFGIAMLSTLMSFYFSIRAFDKRLESLNKFLMGEEYKVTIEESILTMHIRNLNVSSVLCVVLGVFFLFLFITINLP